jgi:hypothetical protein
MNKFYHLESLQGCASLWIALQKTNTENWKQIFSDKELSDHSLNFHVHLSVSYFCIPTVDLPILLQEISAKSWEYINGSQTQACGNCHKRNT